jgi:DUF1680 family protein
MVDDRILGGVHYNVTSTAMAETCCYVEDERAADHAQVKALPFDLNRVRVNDLYLNGAIARNQQYLRSLDPDRLLHNFRINAGLPSSAEPLKGWESPDCELRGHFVGHYLSACAMICAREWDEVIAANADAVVAGLAECQKAIGTGYLSAFPEEFFDRVEAGIKVWAPWYTLHKIYAGLADMYTLRGNTQALEVVKGMIAWAKARTDKLDEEAMQKMLQMEFGGMSAVFCDLYDITGDPVCLELAKRFNHKRVMDPLSEGQDRLCGLHANTQIPKAIGAARFYELTGERYYHKAATFFWDQVVNNRCYAPGGTSNYEYWRELPGRLSGRELGPDDHECCCTHNMLKLTRLLFCWNPDVRYGDYYERAFINGILGTQHQEDGGAYMYYVPMRPGLHRTFCDSDTSYVCCSGTGIESFAKIGDSIYFHDKNGLYVNLFISSELDWRDKGCKIIQETRFPEEEGTRLTIKTNEPVNTTIRIRIPKWVRHGAAEVRINGVAIPEIPLSGTYFCIERTWQDGDNIEVSLPMGLHLSPLPHDPSLAAIMYGPIVLAGVLSEDDTNSELDQSTINGDDPELRENAAILPPVLVTDESVLSDWIKPVSEEPLTFQTVNAGIPHDVILKPFYRIFKEHYAIYWRIYGRDDWKSIKNNRPVLPENTVDAVVIGDSNSEYDHNFQAYRYERGELEGRNWVRSTEWLRYDLDVIPDTPVSLLVTYFGDDSDCDLEIKVNGHKLDVSVLNSAPKGQFVDETYQIPIEITRGKKRVVVALQVPRGETSPPDTTEAHKEDQALRITPRIFGCAIVK